jgi:1-acyl-sn-glycerol-3-phosphate acyltransferase
MWPGELHGLAHLPDHDRFLIVANHSGMGIAEVWSLILAWQDRFAGTRPIAGMAHPAAFGVPPIRYFLEGLGGVEATRAGAAVARASGVPLLLFPGGDQEAMRPFWQASKVDFGGRKGWIRLAREHRLTIVPMCIRGSHRTLPVLAGGRAVAWLTGTRALGFRRAPLTLLSAIAAGATASGARALGAPWWGAGLLAWASMVSTMMVPWVPSRIGFHLLAPITSEALAADADDDAVYRRVVAAIQSRLSATS